MRKTLQNRLHELLSVGFRRLIDLNKFLADTYPMLNPRLSLDSHLNYIVSKRTMFQKPIDLCAPNLAVNILANVLHTLYIQRIPEFPKGIALPLFLAITLTVAFIIRKLVNQHHGRIGAES
ncbi:MAG: hypothetical protein AOA66_1028 [Candidatus Bathyarchaeota archaeon BA2]|nr:MAG: hypothetical protein AOA66_1028 [Candidatus Bathyarchaeota archaeon BA2]